MRYARGSVLVPAGVWSLMLFGACGGASTTPGGTEAGTEAGPELSDGTTGAEASVTTAEGGSAQDASGPDGSMATDASEADVPVPLICQLDASLLTQFAADASLGDSGIAGCYSCIESSCKTQVDACLGDCTCKVNVENLVGCVADAGTNYTTCFAGLISTGDPGTSALVACLIASSCPTACGIAL